MRLSVIHTTEFNYDEPHTYGLQRLRVMPQNGVGQKVLNWDLELKGAKREVDYLDQHGNKVILTSLSPDEDHIQIRALGLVETENTAGVLGRHEGPAPLWYYTRPTGLTRSGPGIEALIADLGEANESPLDRCHALSARILDHVAYRPGETHAETTAEEALGIGFGVCQDHAQIFLAAARKMKFPARYVSGYLMMNDRVVQDASHAWVEVHLPDLGWVGFDVSNGISPDERYIRVASGLDYRDAAPTSGMRFGEHGESMLVEVQVQQ